MLDKKSFIEAVENHLSIDLCIDFERLQSDSRTKIYIGSKNLMIELRWPEDMNSEAYKLDPQEVKSIYIWADWWFHKKEIVCSRLASQLGVCKKIHGRKTTIVRLDKLQAEQFFNKQHLQGYTTAYYKYGLLLNGVIVAAALFSKSRKFDRGGDTLSASVELVRFANIAGTVVVGGLDKLISHFIKTHQPDDLMTYVDKEWSDGKSYKVLKFQKAGETPPQEFLIDMETLRRYDGKRYDGKRSSPLKSIYNLGNIKLIRFCK
jgi:hypothetical protein